MKITEITIDIAAILFCGTVLVLALADQLSWLMACLFIAAKSLSLDVKVPLK